MENQEGLCLAIPSQGLAHVHVQDRCIPFLLLFCFNQLELLATVPSYFKNFICISKSLKPLSLISRPHVCRLRSNDKMTSGQAAQKPPGYS